MAKIDDFVKQQGQFLKAEHVNQDTKAVILGESVVVHNDMYGQDRLHVPVEIEKKEYTFDCSKTNARTIENKLGSETNEWIGKVLVLETYKTKTSEGKMVNAINVKEVSEE